MSECTTAENAHVLGEGELDRINGGKVLEVGIGPVTLQINPESRCWAVWYGKEYVVGGCTK